MKTTGFKAAVVLLAAILMAGQAFAGWGGGGRRGGGRFGPGPDADEQGPWAWRGPGRGGPDAEAWQGAPGRGRAGRYAYPPGAGGQRMGRGWRRGSDRPGGPGTRPGRGGRVGRAYQEGDVCPYCQGSGRRPTIGQRRPMRGNWGQGLRGGRAGGNDFRRGAALPGRSAWNRPGRGLQGRSIGPRGRAYGQGPMVQRRPWGGHRGQDLRPGGIGRGFPGTDFGPQGQGPAMRRRPLEDHRRQGYRPGREGRGFWRGDAPAPDEQGQGLGRPERDERPLPGPRWGRDWQDRPRLRRGPGGPAENPAEKTPDTEAPTEADRPEKDPPTSDES